MNKVYVIFSLVIGVSVVKGFYEKDSVVNIVVGLVLCCLVFYMVLNPSSFVSLGEFFYNSLFQFLTGED